MPEAENAQLRAQVATLTAHLREAEARLQEMSINDPVTGLFSYRYFLGRIAEEVIRADRFNLNLSLLMMSLDQESFEGLLDFAQLLRENSRQYDIIARWGQNELAMLLPAADLDGAKITAERIRLAAASQFESHPAAPGLSVSIGVASYPAEGIESAEELLHAAFQALRLAVDEGGNKTAIRRG